MLPPPEPILKSPLGVASARAVALLDPQAEFAPSQPRLRSELGLRCALTVALEEGSAPPPEPNLRSELAMRVLVECLTPTPTTSHATDALEAKKNSFEGETLAPPAAARKLQCF